MSTKELMKFIESLHDRGLLYLPLDKFDYEWVCYDYLQQRDRGDDTTFFNFCERKKLLNIEYQILKKQKNEND